MKFFIPFMFIAIVAFASARPVPIEIGYFTSAYPWLNGTLGYYAFKQTIFPNITNLFPSEYIPSPFLRDGMLFPLFHGFGDIFPKEIKIDI